MNSFAVLPHGQFIYFSLTSSLSVLYEEPNHFKTIFQQFMTCEVYDGFARETFKRTMPDHNLRVKLDIMLNILLSALLLIFK